jgi:hypothetical protein
MNALDGPKWRGVYRLGRLFCHAIEPAPGAKARDALGKTSS